MKEYRRKSLIVKAEQFSSGVFPEGVKHGYVQGDGQVNYYLKTLGGNKDIEKGDWVIFDGNDRFVCSHEEFQKNYELIGASTSQTRSDPRAAHASDERQVKPL